MCQQFDNTIEANSDASEFEDDLSERMDQLTEKMEIWGKEYAILHE